MGNIEDFFEPAKKFCLNETELSACRKRMMHEMQKKPVRAGEAECLTDDMTDFDPHLITSAQAIRLSPEESKHVGGILHAFMKDHPVNMAAAVRKREKQERPPIWRTLFAFRSAPSFAAVLLLVLGGGSLSYAAESALPGDPLYTVKVHVNEEVHAALSLSAEAKANWEAKRAERRVKEAKKLAAAGKLTPEKRTVLVKAFNTHITATHNGIRRMAERGEQDKAERVGKKTEDTLRNEAENITDTEGDIAVILQNVQRATDDTVALDLFINGSIAMNNAGTSMMQMNAGMPSADSSEFSDPIAAMDTGRSNRRAKDDTERKNEDDENDLMRHQMGMAPFKTTRKQSDASSFSSTGCGSSALSMRSKSSSSVTVHASSTSDTPVTIDIKSDGSIDVNIDALLQADHAEEEDASVKKNTIEW